jgi:hypothetical protein
MDKPIFKFFSLLIFIFTTSTALAGSMQVSISGFSADAQLYIDFIDGDGPSNSIALSSFSSDGVITLKELTGSAASTATGYEMADTSFLNSVALSLANVTSLNFLISFSNNAPSIDGFLDSIGVYLYGDEYFNPVVPTDDPLGANALFSWFATGEGNGGLQTFSSLSSSPLTWNVSFVDPQVPVSEPGMLFLLLIAMYSLFLLRMKNQEV